MTYKHHLKTSITTIAVLLLLSLFVMKAFAEPGGPIITYLKNETSSTVGNPANRSGDDKGTITTMLLNISQQSLKWKAYVGNVTGHLTLDDASNYTIYDWMLASIQGEVYATRTSGVITWSGVICANDTVVAAEMSGIGHPATATDSLNRTFNYTTHSTFQAGAANFEADTCNHTTYLYENDSAQSTDWQEILLFDGTNVVYTSILEDSDTDIGYWWYNETQYGQYDFQMIVGENSSATEGFPYYFYVELG